MPGPFDKYLPWYAQGEGSPNVEDRTDLPWAELTNGMKPQMGSETVDSLADRVASAVQSNSVPPVTALGRDLGARDVGPVTPEELIKFLIDVDSYNPDPPGRKVGAAGGSAVPMPRPDPRRR